MTPAQFATLQHRWDGERIRLLAYRLLIEARLHVVTDLLNRRHLTSLLYSQDYLDSRMRRIRPTIEQEYYISLGRLVDLERDIAIHATAVHHRTQTPDPHDSRDVDTRRRPPSPDSTGPAAKRRK